jgi:excisionase family DNA binding protein
MINPKDNKPITRNEAMKLLRISLSTLIRWINKNKLAWYRTGAGQLLYNLEEILDLVKNISISSN